MFRALGPATIAAILLLGGCGRGGQQPATAASPTIDPEVRTLRAQLAQALAERDAALARLHAMQRKAGGVRVIVRETAPAPAQHERPVDSGQPQVFTTLSTSATP